MKNIKPGQRLAYYEVTGMSDPKPSPTLEVGSILIDRPRGPETSWEFMNFETGEKAGWIAAKRVGFARVGEDGKSHIHEPGLAAYLAEAKLKHESSE